MANRFTRQFVSSLAPEVSLVYCKVTFGATGAPSINPVSSKGIISVTRTGTGEFVFAFGSIGNTTLIDLYAKLLSCGVSFQTGSTTIPAAPIFNVVGNGSGSTGTITIQLYSAAGSAADPASGETSYFYFNFQNSTAT